MFLEKCGDWFQKYFQLMFSNIFVKYYQNVLEQHLFGLKKVLHIFLLKHL